AAELLAPDLERPNDDASYLPAALTRLMRDIGIPNGIGDVGYGDGDVPGLVEGAMKQQRLLAGARGLGGGAMKRQRLPEVAPGPVTEDALAAILSRSLSNW